MDDGRSEKSQNEEDLDFGSKPPRRPAASRPFFKISEVKRIAVDDRSEGPKKSRLSTSSRGKYIETLSCRSC